MTSKVVGLDTKQRPVDSCQFCGHEPAHPFMTCPRLKYLEIFDDGTPCAVEFFEPEIWKPRA